MLIVETIGRIRREHFSKGKSIKEIARELKISRNTVRKVLRSGETSFSYEREIQPRPKLGRWQVEIDRMLTQNAGNAARERLTLIRLFEELRALSEENANLKQTLHQRKVIERAKGVLMQRHRWTEAEAFRRLQRAAMNRRASMFDLAQDVLNGVAVHL